MLPYKKNLFERKGKTNFLQIQRFPEKNNVKLLMHISEDFHKINYLCRKFDNYDSYDYWSGEYGKRYRVRIGRQ